MEAVRSRPESIGVDGVTTLTEVGRVIFWLRFTASSTVVEAEIRDEINKNVNKPLKNISKLQSIVLVFGIYFVEKIPSTL